MKKSIFIILFFLIVSGFFELHPAVKDAQSYVSLKNYDNIEASCQDILAERPWYGKINYWFFIWVIFVPAVIFSISPSSSSRTSSWMHGSIVVIAAGICYVFMNLAVHLQWDIRNASFSQDPFNPDPLNGWRIDCANYAGDGFSYVTALIFAWIPACIYTGLCLSVWKSYHCRFSKEIMDDYKDGFITRILFLGLKIYVMIVMLYLALCVIFAASSYFLGGPAFHPGIIWFIGFFIVRPLLIPFEIFTYS